MGGIWAQNCQVNGCWWSETFQTKLFFAVTFASMPFQPKGFLFCQLHSTLFINIRSFDFDFFFTCFRCYQPNYPWYFSPFKYLLSSKLARLFGRRRNFFFGFNEPSTIVIKPMRCRMLEYSLEAWTSFCNKQNWGRSFLRQSLIYVPHCLYFTNLHSLHTATLSYSSMHYLLAFFKIIF